mmetsp:Transcript_5358/g.7895  ORF Transcript_5358/g.7895 Transcript_5358/m.7895 type:complete len:223 (-) Transcript_5358:91-759(-)
MIIPIINSELVTGKVVFVLNCGLHAREEEPYKDTLRWLFQYFKKHLNQHVVMFRETSAQHFKTRTGEFPWNDRDFSWSFPEQLSHDIKSNLSTLTGHLFRVGNMLRKEDIEDNSGKELVLESSKQESERLDETLYDAYSCAPIESHQQLDEQNWKGKMVSIVLEELNLQESIGIIPFFNLTAGRHDLHSFSKKDCSHYCNAPLLWLPVWDSIARYYESQVHN